jgi:benzodiazapine receptor
MERTTSPGLTVAIATIPVIAAWAAGMLATFPNLEPWYAGLIKPSFNPPDWVFGPVWVTLYFLMAIAVWRILRSEHQSRQLALTAFFMQLSLNAAWSWMFFAAQSPLLGLLNIVPQLILVVVTAGMFFRIDRQAGWVLIPLCLWVGFAAALNFSIWWLNK